MRHTLLALLFIASGAWATPYDICIISDNPDPVCFVLDTPLPKEDIIAVVEYPDGVLLKSISLELKFSWTVRTMTVMVLTMNVSWEYLRQTHHIIPTALTLAVVCSGTTLLVTKADGEGGTYTNSQGNSLQCGYVAPPDDPCYNGPWYVGYGNPECEDVGDVEYRLFCTEVGEDDYYGLAKQNTLSALVNHTHKHMITMLGRHGILLGPIRICFVGIVVMSSSVSNITSAYPS